MACLFTATKFKLASFGGQRSGIRYFFENKLVFQFNREKINFE